MRSNGKLISITEELKECEQLSNILILFNMEAESFRNGRRDLVLKIAKKGAGPELETLSSRGS
jgi:hypothetical protein